MHFSFEKQQNMSITWLCTKLYLIYFCTILSPVKIGLVLQFPSFSKWKGKRTDKLQFNLFWQLLESSHCEGSHCLLMWKDAHHTRPKQKEKLLFYKWIQACVDILAKETVHMNPNRKERERRGRRRKVKVIKKELMLRTWEQNVNWWEGNSFCVLTSLVYFSSFIFDLSLSPLFWVTVEYS